MKPWGWVAFQAAGIAACHLLGWWVAYWVTFAMVEVAGIFLAFPFTWTVRGFLAGREGRSGFLRDLVVCGWCGWIISTWVIHAPLPPTAVGLVSLAFGVWIWAHFFGDRWG